ncbi:PIR Superfamily Protein [Plasmodium ovale wallikeri]|uniref:PIR Superfamily Protein n=1 Tax=Plasmodium ovale wallikeri TaxID=864142 RepID=A0A1A9AG36_PLAOA|nr:PIR Superfamily Protein [Plasmodium ovale wallikeri]SBT55514.1 PIR Superfamily Protein [Plasmodium ovale wallikeri]
MDDQCAEASVLPSCKLYEEFGKKNDDKGNFVSECKNLQSKLSSEQAIFDLCQKLAGNIRDFCDNHNGGNFLKDNFVYLHYWLLDQLIKTFKISDSGTYSGKRNQFFQEWKNIIQKLPYKQKCEPMKRDFSSHFISDFKNIKDMYDYYYNYKNFPSKNSFTEIECNTYCTYLSSIIKKFPSFKSLCSKTSRNCIPEFKDSIDNYDPNQLLEKLGCNSDNLCTKNFEKEQPVKEERARGDDPHVLADDTSDGPVETSQPSETSPIAITFGLLLSGIFTISFVLFKLTPMGALLKNQLFKKEKMTEYLDYEASNEMLNDELIMDNIKLQEKGYNITYNSFQNLE